MALVAVELLELAALVEALLSVAVTELLELLAWLCRASKSC